MNKQPTEIKSKIKKNTELTVFLDVITIREENIAIIEIDEDSLDEYGQWPWKRDLIAQGIIKAYESGAQLVVVPILFAEKDRLGGDQELIELLTEAPVIIGQSASTKGKGEPVPRGLATIGESLDSWKNDVYVTDKQTNTTITSNKKNARYYSGENQTTMLLELLKKRIPESNVLGFFVAGSGARGIVRREIIQDKMGLSWDDTDTLKKCQKELRTNKVLVCKTAGYDEYYILPSIPKVDENDEEGIQVKENAKTGDLKRAFAKFSKSKTLNRQLLNKFIGQVA